MLHLSDTKIKAFDKCPMNGYWLYERNISHAGVKLELEFGEAAHAGLYTLLKNKGDLLVAGNEFLARFDMEDPRGIRTKEKGLEVLGAFYEQYMQGRGLAGIQGEVKISKSILNGTVEYEGRLDQLIMWEDKPTVMEFKTSSAPGFFITKPNQQVTAYPFLASLEFGQRIDQVLVIIAGLYKYSKNGYRTTKQGDSVTIFREELVTVEDWEFESWQLDVAKKAKSILKFEEDNYWPKYTESCSDFGGCQFLPLCATNPKLHDLLIESRYVPYKEKKEVGK